MDLLRSLSLVLFVAFARPVVAGPAEDLLRVAPPDAAFVFVVRDASTHVANLRNSPFAESLARTPLGQRVLESPDLRKLRAAITFVSAQTDTPATSFLTDILGQALVFAMHPSPENDPRKERAILLVRPAKPEVLDRFVERLNALQIANGEITEVSARTHRGEGYSERRKSTGTSEFYASRRGTFAFTTSEDELRAFLERDRTVEKSTAFVDSISRLGVESAAVVLLLNPRALDVEMAAKVAAGKPSEKAFLEWFATYWKKLDSAALYLRLDKNAELGLSLRARPGETLLGSSPPSALWSSIPEDALLACAGRQQLSELVNSIDAVLPPDGRRALRSVVEQTLAPVIGKDKLPLVVDSVGPNWAFWFEGPRNEGVLPVAIFALEVQSDGPKATEAMRALLGAMQYLFQTIRVMHNARRMEQIDFVEETQGDLLIRSLVGEKTFPPHVRPSFGLKDGYLLIASNADAIRSFRKPIEKAEGGDVPLARFSVTALRSYLRSKGAALSAILAEQSGSTAANVERALGEMSDSLEPFDRLELLTRTTGATQQLALRLTTSKPLKP